MNDLQSRDNPPDHSRRYNLGVRTTEGLDRHQARAFDRHAGSVSPGDQALDRRRLNPWNHQKFTVSESSTVLPVHSTP